MIAKERDKLKRYEKQRKEDCLALGWKYSNLLFVETDPSTVDCDNGLEGLMEA